jgi:hypothetical protein
MLVFTARGQQRVEIKRIQRNVPIVILNIIIPPVPRAAMLPFPVTALLDKGL